MSDKEKLLSDSEVVRRKGNTEKWEELNNFFFNPNTQEFMGRDLEEWVKTILYYGCFYLGVFFYFLFFLTIFLLRVDEIDPAVTHYDSPIQMNPGMTMRPVPDFESSLIRFEQGKPHSYKPFTDHMQTFLWDYENEKQVGENFIDCSSDGRQEQPDTKVCRFDVNTLGDNCTWQKDYGYDEGQPCILLKLNRVYDWKPEAFPEDEVPEEMEGRYDDNYVGVTCEGKYAADKENIGVITYEPRSGFPFYYFPFLVQEGYRSPLVMVKFNNPVNGVLINVVCKLWAKNIKHNYNDNAGLIKFELLVD